MALALARRCNSLIIKDLQTKCIKSENNPFLLLGFMYNRAMKEKEILKELQAAAKALPVGTVTNMGTFQGQCKDSGFFLFETKAGTRIMGEKTLHFVQVR
jgi:hypothetical protein